MLSATFNSISDPFLTCLLLPPHSASNYTTTLTFITCLYQCQDYDIYHSIMNHPLNHSCVTQLAIILMEDIPYALGHQIDVIFLDFSKPFDISNSWTKLQCNNSTLTWNEHWHSRCSQCVVLDSETVRLQSLYQFYQPHGGHIPGVIIMTSLKISVPLSICLLITISL